jgi:calcium permeable stress-gated cation channel
MGTVGLVFAPLAPLVVVGAAIVMWINSWVYKYQLMYCYVSKVETGGVSSLFDHLFYPTNVS